MDIGSLIIIYLFRPFILWCTYAGMSIFQSKRDLYLSHHHILIVRLQSQTIVNCKPHMQGEICAVK